MASARILVVEDEHIVAKDVQSRLEGLGYDVPAVAVSGEEALRKAAETQPDLVVMDIKLKGEMDGVEASHHMRDRFKIPVVYLTAYADDHTLERAKITEPFGYVIKPFEERELRTNIELALYKHRMERKLRESEQWLATTLKSIGDGVIATDNSERVTFMNPIAEALTGWKQRDAIGRKLSQIFKIVSEDTSTPVENPVTKALREGQTAALAIDTALVDRDGARIPIADTAAPIRDDRGNLSGAVLVFRDITDYKRAEERLREAQKLQSVGQLAGGIAHEFNNLLMVIRGHNELLLGRLSRTDPLRRNAEEVRGAADRAASLTQQLLAFSRRQMLHPRVLDLNAVIRGMGNKLRPLMGRDIELVTVLSPELGRVEVDLGQVQEIVLNLAVNARDAMPRGGKLTLVTSNVELNETSSRRHRGVRPGPYVLLAVSDNGAGMDAETQARIFEPFFTTKERAKSSGLGLATIHGIVMQSGGYIWAHSEVGKGTTFQVYLPRVDEEVETRGEARATAISLPEARVILLVERETGIRKLIRDFLESNGYTVLGASDGTEALQISGRHKGTIDLLLTDVVMLGMSGHELIERLLPQRPGVKVLYMADLTDAAVLQDRDPGAEFLRKPFSLDALKAKLDEMLGEEREK